MNSFSHVPPGFRFHPTDKELVDYYLRKKVATRKIELDVIKDVDLYKIEPWDLQELCRLGCEEQNDWYFFSHKDKKYPTGTRTNRATTAGFWKVTGRDKPIYAKHNLVGMRKTLVFYKGRAPNGQKSDWIMHEYRLETNENAAPQEEGWVVCHAFKKRVMTVRRASEHELPYWYDDRVSFVSDIDSPKTEMVAYQHLYSCKPELELHYNLPDDPFFLQLPQSESPKFDEPIERAHRHQIIAIHNSTGGQVTDWRLLDKFIASQLSQENATDSAQDFQVSDQPKVVVEIASTSNSSSPIDSWK